MILTGKANAFNPGIHYYKSEAAKAYKQAYLAKIAEQAGDRYRTLTKKHERLTNKALKVSVSQEMTYNRMLNAESSFLEANRNAKPYPRADIYNQSLNGRLINEVGNGW